MRKISKFFSEEKSKKTKIYIKLKEKKNGLLFYLISFFLILIALLILLVIYVTPIYKISSSEMEPTYNKNDVVVTLKTDNYKIGDVVVFYYNNKVLIKRIIALPEDVITLSSSNKLVINGSEVKESYISGRDFSNLELELPYVVEKGHYFVLNDNHENDLDSRNINFGCVSESQIIAVVKFRIWPI